MLSKKAWDLLLYWKRFVEHVVQIKILWFLSSLFLIQIETIGVIGSNFFVNNAHTTCNYLTIGKFNICPKNIFKRKILFLPKILHSMNLVYFMTTRNTIIFPFSAAVSKRATTRFAKIALSIWSLVVSSMFMPLHDGWILNFSLRLTLVNLEITSRYGILSVKWKSSSGSCVLVTELSPDGSKEESSEVSLIIRYAIVGKLQVK